MEKEVRRSGNDEVIELALKRIRSAFFVAVFLFIYTAGLLFMTWRSNPDNTDGLLFGIGEPILLLAFATWMLFTKSRNASLALLILFLSGKLFLIAPFFFSNMPTDTLKALAPALVPQVLWLIIAGYYFINGIRGSFLLHKFNQKVTGPRR